MLKRLSCTLGLLALLAATAQASTPESVTLTREISIDPSRVTVREAGGVSFVALQGGVHALPAGAPDLPLLPVHLRLPEGTVAVEVRVIPLETTALPGRHRLPGVSLAKPGVWAEPGAVDPAILASGASYPREAYRSHLSGRMRGRSLTSVSVAPLAWNPDTGELVLTSRFRVEVTTRPTASSPDDLVILRESREGERSFTEAVRLMTGESAAGGFDRGSALRPLVNSGEPFAPTFRPSVDGSAVDMVIITTADQEAEYQRLADFKTRIGISTVVRTVDWIRANYHIGVDNEETIRNFIRDAASMWGTAWVLLGGDTDQIPIRYAYTTFYGSEDIPTDLYYTDLDGTWNADGDATFGEGFFDVSIPGDEVDLYPDVWVGRLSSNNVTEAQVMVDKALDYQQNPPLGYQNDHLLLGEVLFPSTWYTGLPVQFDGALVCEDVADSSLAHHRNVKLYENYTAWPGSYPETKEAVIDSFNAGYHLVEHVGHGFINTMSVGINHQTLINADVDAFTNGGRTFLLYAINCTSAAVDFNCIAERFVANANGGSIGVVGSTRLDFPSTGRFYQNEFYSLLWRYGVHELGKATAMSKVEFIPFSGQDNPHRWTQYTQIYLGDPNLDFYTDVPGTLDVVHAGTFELGAGTYTVNVTLEGSPVDSARVALYKDGDAYSVGYTDGAGQAVLPFRPDETGSFSVGVWVHDSLPWLDTGTVTAPGAPYLFALDQLIDDDGFGGSIGNSDNQTDAGETVELRFTLKNNGGATETGITATLASTNPYLVITDGNSAFANIGPGSSQLASDPFTIQVSRNAPDRTEAPCTLVVTGSQGVYTQEIILYVHAPVFEYYAQSVRDSVGNGNDNDLVEANEDFVILPRIRNLGLAEAIAVEARLRSGDPAVTVTDSVSVLGNIAPDGIASNPGDGLKARLSDVGSYHELEIVLVDAYGEVFSVFVDVVAPAEPAGLVSFGSASSISLTWDAMSEPGLWGFNVYRAGSESGPYARVNDFTTEFTAYYRDEGLPPLTRYYYKVAAVDSSGNEGPVSVTASATTSLPLHSGFPVKVVTATTGGITLADLDGDQELEILAAGEEIYAVTHEGDDFFDGDNDVRTHGPLTSTGNALFWNTPAVGDVDGDGDPEIAAVGWNDTLGRLVDAQGVSLPNWPRDVNPLSYGEANPLGSVCLADVDADGDLEYFCAVAQCILAWHHDGTELADGDSNPATDGVLVATPWAYSYGTPSVANIDDEPYGEIMGGMRDGKLYVFEHDGTPYPGFPYATGGDITGSPAVGDIDRDGRVEIIFGSSNSLVHAIRADGSSATGFPRGIQLMEDFDSSPAIGDVTGDGFPDVVIGASNGALFMFRGNDGGVPSGFPVQIRDNLGNKVPIRSSPVIADVDGDSSLDIVVGDQIGRLHGFDSSGQYLPGFPIQTGNLIESTPAVWDVDGDGLTEVLAQSFDQKIYCWDTPWTFNETLAPWPMFKRNPRNTGVYDEPVFGAVGVPDRGPLARPMLMQNFPNPFPAATAVMYRVPEGTDYRRVTLRVYDLSGRVVKTLVDGEQPPGLHELQWDGRDEGGRRVAAGIYPYRLQVAGEDLMRKMVLLK